MSKTLCETTNSKSNFDQVILGTISSVLVMTRNNINVVAIHYLVDDSDPHPIGSTT
ncbi:MAG: hypothetical protein JNL67_07405 [Planctomycetaceae bacterium]|nr:hypothetical protein [Planctomycetaceae bacterium]